MIALKGAMAAIVTPFRSGSIDKPALQHYVQHLLEQGIEGIVACGTTGEAATLSEAERIEVVQIVTETVNHRVPVIAGISTNDTQRAIRAAQNYQRDTDADVLLVVTPYYNKPNQEGLYRHFTAVAEASTLPIIVYNVPSRTARRVEVPTLKRLSKHPKIIATKDATGDMTFLTESLAACEPDFAILSGDDFSYLPFLALGGHGGISVVANVAPQWIRDLKTALHEDLNRARALHQKIVQVAKLMFSDVNPIPVKAALSLQGLIQDEMRLPLVPMEPDQKQALAQALKSHGLL